MVRQERLGGERMRMDALGVVSLGEARQERRAKVSCDE